MIQYKIATTVTEKESAISLVKGVYVREGYLKSASDDVASISDYINLPEAVTVLAQEGDFLGGTITMVLDSSGGLPMDIIYRDELSEFRSGGHKLAEVCQFAVDWDLHDDGASKHSNPEVSLGLLSHVIHSAIRCDVTHLCFTINPKHAGFYQSMGCVQIGGEKEYPLVNSAPALAFMLDLKAIVGSIKEGVMPKFSLIKKMYDFKPAESFFDKLSN